MTSAEIFALMRAHESNVRRYRRLLETKLAPVEQTFLERRLAEEEATLSHLQVGNEVQAENRQVPSPG